LKSCFRELCLPDEKVTHIILRSDEQEQQDSILTLTILQPENYQLQSIQLLSNARHIEVLKKKKIIKTIEIYFSSHSFILMNILAVVRVHALLNLIMVPSMNRFLNLINQMKN